MADYNIPDTLTISEENLQISALRTLLLGFHRMLYKELYYDALTLAELKQLTNAYETLEPTRRALGLHGQ